MEIIVGKNAGFCYGVKNAVESSQRDLTQHHGKICFLGEIVHNQQVVEELQKEGAIFVDSIDEAQGTVVIRAHGIAKGIYEKAKEKNLCVKDYTCPNVLKIHQIAEEYAHKGYYILLFGSKKHPETIGTMSYCGSQYYVVEDEVELYNAIEIINRWQVKQVLVLSQTTFHLDLFYQFQSILEDELSKGIHLVVKNTICRATQDRQMETEAIAQQVDCMIIVGGKNSSNTKRLYEIAEENCTCAICVETQEDIKNVDFSLFQKIGIMAGTSTPQSSIDAIVEKLKS